ARLPSRILERIPRYGTAPDGRVQPRTIHARTASFPVNVTPVSDSDHLDDEPVIEHLVDDAVVADANPVGPVLAGESDAARRSRRPGKEVNRRPNPLLIL